MGKRLTQLSTGLKVESELGNEIFDICNNDDIDIELKWQQLP